MNKFDRMLVHLSITNYALIDHLEWEPGDGFNVITGETGAGKSILLGALGLILGERAESSKKKCIIEGKFKGEVTGIKNQDLRFKGWFKEKDLDYNEDIILRREIGTDGKSRAFINDTPVTLQVLRELGDQLVDIHSQHETLFLNRSGFQAELLDLVAGNTQKLEKYSDLFSTWRSGLLELQQREDALARQVQERDFIQFQFSELEEINLNDLSQGELESDLRRQENAESFRKVLGEAEEVLGHETDGVVSKIRRLRKMLSVLEKDQPALLERLDAAYRELDDLRELIIQEGEKAIPDERKKEKLEKILNTLYHLQQKHRVETVEELLQKKQEFADQLETTLQNSEEIDRLKRSNAGLEEELRALALELRKARKKAIASLQTEIETILRDLAMPHAALKIVMDALEIPALRGMDSIRFLFSANPGQDPQELGKVASGGELSRLMLALKSVTARLTSMPTIIFDEIDSGISGSVAGKMASILEKMGKNMQVVAITHLPQVAGKGTTHFKVFKDNKGKGTQTGIRRLSHDERVREIAQMLSSVKPSENAIRTANELLSHS